MTSHPQHRFGIHEIQYEKAPGTKRGGDRIEDALVILVTFKVSQAREQATRSVEGSRLNRDPHIMHPEITFGFEFLCFGNTLLWEMSMPVTRMP